MKTQMKAQKYLALATLIFSALCIVFGFLFNSGMLYEIKFYADSQVGGAKELTDYAQWANDVIVIMAIVMLLCTVVLYITATNTRRNYYITNYIAVGLVVLYSVACAITFLVIMGNVFSLCAKVDVETWYKMFSDIEDYGGGIIFYKNPQHYSLNKIMPILGVIIAVIMIAAAVLWVLNTVWKIKLMQGEKALLEKGAVQTSELKEVA